MTPYVRPSLPGTRSGKLRPAAYATSLEERAEECHDCPYDLIAATAALLRVRPALRRPGAAYGEDKSVPWGELVALAISAPPLPDGWLREAAAVRRIIADSRTGLVSESAALTMADRAARMLDDLDDAELVAWVARREGHQIDDLEAGLLWCREWLAANPATFYGAGFLVQTIGAALRPDLAGIDLALAMTADKFVVLLDHLESHHDRA